MGRQRNWKQNRRELRKYIAALDKKKRLEMKVPRWIRLVGFFYPPIKARWVHSWEKKHAEKPKRAIKDVSHQLAVGKLNK